MKGRREVDRVIVEVQHARSRESQDCFLHILALFEGITGSSAFIGLENMGLDDYAVQ